MPLLSHCLIRHTSSTSFLQEENESLYMVMALGKLPNLLTSLTCFYSSNILLVFLFYSECRISMNLVVRSIFMGFSYRQGTPLIKKPAIQWNVILSFIANLLFYKDTLVILRTHMYPCRLFLV